MRISPIFDDGIVGTACRIKRRRNARVSNPRDSRAAYTHWLRNERNLVRGNLYAVWIDFHTPVAERINQGIRLVDVMGQSHRSFKSRRGISRDILSICVPAGQNEIEFWIVEKVGIRKAQQDALLECTEGRVERHGFVGAAKIDSRNIEQDCGAYPRLTVWAALIG